MAEFIIPLVEHNYNHYLQTYKALLNWSQLVKTETKAHQKQSRSKELDLLCIDCQPSSSFKTTFVGKININVFDNNVIITF